MPMLAPITIGAGTGGELQVPRHQLRSLWFSSPTQSRFLSVPGNCTLLAHSTTPESYRKPEPGLARFAPKRADGSDMSCDMDCDISSADEEHPVLLYLSIPLGSDNVCLLRLISNKNETAMIECELLNHSLESGKGIHPYAALSYIWGSPKPILKMSCFRLS
ncbi:hypothetical protein FB567DRAFT_255332 [Paraphoma chrysanthemicola]|uniref:Heterokaryon incompatibility domain-containing protein n=1 Tax=Paraphoma chrysanthemicola TaxID=798071 RepID=A0A8K0QR78_9PLEO|nr:hypothetical protein FB567DRAFT_255332 [Paraphoma chrysanthemicola]